MDLNLVVLAGKLAAPPELRTFDSGTRLLRFLVTARSEEPRRRVDVVPVTLWDPDDAMVAQVETLDLGDHGRRLWVAGAVQRRFWEAPEGRRSRLEVVAHQVDIKPPEEDDDAAAC
ncbi:MAG TPA: single-stranded DNA-binding protein [Acidimicrobiia bacterium]|jgi:single-strand DNA-binding protein